MAYNRINWLAHVVTQPNTYSLIDNGDGTKTFLPVYGEVVTQGTPLTATNLNVLDIGINDAHNAIASIIDGTQKIGVSIDSDKLGGVAASQFMRNDVNATLNGDLAITGSVGITASYPAQWFNHDTNDQNFEIQGNNGVDLRINNHLGNALQMTPFKIDWATGMITVSSLTVLGDTDFQGYNTVIDAVNMTVEDNLITVNSNQVGIPSTGLVSGIEVERGDYTNYFFAFEESTDTFSIGQVGSLQPVATREYSPIASGIGIWDDANSRFTTVGQKTAFNRNFTTSQLPAAGDNGSGVTVARGDHMHDLRYLKLTGGVLSNNLQIDNGGITVVAGGVDVQTGGIKIGNDYDLVLKSTTVNSYSGIKTVNSDGSKSMELTYDGTNAQFYFDGVAIANEIYHTNYKPNWSDILDFDTATAIVDSSGNADFSALGISQAQILLLTQNATVQTKADWSYASGVISSTDAIQWETGTTALILFIKDNR